MIRKNITYTWTALFYPYHDIEWYQNNQSYENNAYRMGPAI